VNVLVVNIGSTSFKFRLLDMADEQVLARGGVEGVGKTTAQVMLQVGAAPVTTAARAIASQAAAVEWCLAELAARDLRFDAVGFKAVHGGDLPEAVRVTPEVLAVMEEFADAAPAHNPAYVAAMRAFAAQRPQTPLVAAFETGFHRTVPAARAWYAVPHDWGARYGVRRYGFHGASHRYIATRVAARLGRNDLRIISCHLGGSSSLCAIRGLESVANSLGMTPQTGLPQNNRVGDFDPYALLVLKRRTGRALEDLLAEAAQAGGLLGLSGVSNEMPAILAAAARGDARAALAVDVFVESARHYLGAYVVALGGLDVLAFTGGIGERSAEIRRRVCAGLEFLGVRLDEARNEAARGETTISADGTAVTVLVLPTNEELVVARQTVAVLAAAGLNGCPDPNRHRGAEDGP